MPPDQLRLQMATRDFQSTRLFGTAEPLLEAIESRGRKSSADQTLFFVTVVCNQLDEITFANASAEGRAMGMEQTID